MTRLIRSPLQRCRRRGGARGDLWSADAVAPSQKALHRAPAPMEKHEGAGLEHELCSSFVFVRCLHHQLIHLRWWEVYFDARLQIFCRTCGLQIKRSKRWIIWTKSQNLTLILFFLNPTKLTVSILSTRWRQSPAEAQHQLLDLTVLCHKRVLRSWCFCDSWVKQITVLFIE